MKAMLQKDEILDTIKEFFTGEKKHIAWISCALICMTCAALVIFVVQKRKKPAAAQNKERELIVNQKLLIPDGPEVQKGYITSRQSKPEWDDSDTERWLTVPSKKELTDLGRANDQIISDLTGAAP
jgi:hypothetical protein